MPEKSPCGFDKPSVEMETDAAFQFVAKESPAQICIDRPAGLNCRSKITVSDAAHKGRLKLNFQTAF
ncbi:Uncharacterised protein [Neisseria meningitidis]|nr:hypothetical protein [Neisseria flavescens]SPY01418.1 Uncharacterised protein [Neisseria meningitidis]